MRRLSGKFLAVTLALVAVASIWGLSAFARTHSKVQKAQVRFLATSFIVRGTLGYNRDTFLVELWERGTSEPIRARLVDEYPNAALPISADAQESSEGTPLRILRDPQCDIPYKDLVLQTAPGDPMAILPERFGFTPDLDRMPSPDSIVPCYRTVRR